VGILFATYFGGQIFDKIAYSAPFTMMAGVNAVIAIWALFIRFRTADTSTQTVGSPP
jgi:predicted MFS family arabinose efflux permease